MSSMKVVETIAERLAAAGVKRIYGLPGGEMLDILEATRQAGIQFVLVHHEAAAAFMAAAEGHHRRSLAACISTIGPGATNLVSGIAHAYLDRCPVIALTADLPTTLGQDYTHQRLDLPRLFAPITKGSYILEAKSAASVTEAAIALATTEPFGPVSLHIPRDVALQQAEIPATPTYVSIPACHGDLSVEAVAAKLNQAEHPLVIVGLGTPPAAAEAIRHFVEVYGAPAGVTPKVKGILDERHPLFTGTYGGMMAESVLIDFIRERDLILCIGVDPTELDRDWPGKERFVWLLPSLNVGQSKLPANAWCGALEPGLQQLSQLVEGGKFDSRAEAASLRRAVRAKLEKGIPAQPRGMSPLRAIETLAEVWPASERVCCDVGAHKLLMGQAWPATVPNRFFMSNGLSAMGFGIAAPIALSLAAEGAPVLSVIGDGGLLMYLGELETAVREGAHVLYVVFCDASLALIESSQRRRGYTKYGMQFNAPEVVHLGTFFGLPAWQASSKAEITEAIRAFTALNGPALLGVTIDPREYDHQIS